MVYQPKLTSESSLPLGRVSEFVDVAEACESLGLSAGAICRRLGLPLWHDCAPDAYAPVEHLRRFIDGAAHAAGSRLFGFSIREASRVENLDVVGLALARSANLYQALKLACRLMRSHSNCSKYWLDERKDDVVWLCRGSRPLVEMGDEVTTQYALSGMIQTVQCGAGKTWWPDSIVLQDTGPIALPPVERSGEVTVRYHPNLTAIAVSRDLLPQPVRCLHPDPPMPFRTALDEQAFLQTALPDTLVGVLKQLIATMMPHGSPSIETLAEIAGTHPRTLQRSLRRQSTSYRQLVDEVRAEQATVLLKADDASVTAIAFDLGYNDLAHFSRAFRRWTGVSPRAYRRIARVTA